MIVHLNGRLVPRDEAVIPVFDRGFIFGDALYEGLRAWDGHVVGLDHHIARLASGLAEARFEGFEAESLRPLTAELLDANGLTDAFIYWQVSRGAPAPGSPVRERIPRGLAGPTVFGYAEADVPLDTMTEPRRTTGVTMQDPRWARGHLKSASLMANVLAAFDAADHDGADPILLRGDTLAESAMTNVFIATGDRIATPALESAPILHGVTPRPATGRRGTSSRQSRTPAARTGVA